MQTHLDWQIVIGLAAQTAASYAAIAALARRAFGLNTALGRLRNVLAFLAVDAVTSGAVRPDFSSLSALSMRATSGMRLDR